jgi:hypothetical protein
VAADPGKASAGPGERGPRPRGAHAAAKSGPFRPAAPRAPAPGPASGLTRATAANLCMAALVAAVVPLAILQIPDAIALPAMAVAVPFGGLATRRFRTGPVLLAGLLAIGAADALGDAARTVLLIGVDRSLHGLGAGVSMAALAAIVADRRQPTRFLAGWWACAVVCALAAAPVLMRHRMSVGDWRAALQPYPWLAGAAVALAALYAILAEGTARTTARSIFPTAERALLTLLAAPVAGMCAVTVAVTYRGNNAVVAAAIADAIALAGVAVMAVRASTAGRLVAVCAVTGFTVAPAAGAVTALIPPGQPGWEAGCAVLAAAICGAALALTRRSAPIGSAQIPPRRSARTATATGLGVAAAAFGAASVAGSAVARTGVLALLCVPLAGGLAAALAAALRGAGAGTGTGGAVCAVALLLAGVVGGYLASGAVRLQALQGARTAAAVHAALVATTVRWAFLAAAVTATIALVMAVAPGRRGSVRPADSGAPPVRRAGGTPIVGKLDGGGE